jgi:glucose dehydrogenase
MKRAAGPFTLRIALSSLALALALSLGGCSGHGDSGVDDRDPPQPRRFAAVDEQRLANADREPQNWYNVHRASGSDHYSPLGDINQGNVSSLGFAWQYKTNTTRGLQASPIVIDGVMYSSGTWGRVYAVDAKSGAEIWTYDPKVKGEWGRRGCCDIVNDRVSGGGVRVMSLGSVGLVLSSPRRRAERADCLPETAVLQVRGNVAAVATHRSVRAAARRRAE